MRTRAVHFLVTSSPRDTRAVTRRHEAQKPNRGHGFKVEAFILFILLNQVWDLGLVTDERPRAKCETPPFGPVTGK